MTGLIHMRGDVTGALLFFTVLFLGTWQLVVAWKRLNGLSLTGYPDRRRLSFATGLVLVTGSCVWYFSRPGHFASPDVEGFEMLLLLVGALIIATAIQVAIASFAFRRLYRPATGIGASGSPVFMPADEVTLTVGETTVPALFGPPAGSDTVGGVLLLHDYGGAKEDTNIVAAHLRFHGYATVSVDLDGHGENPRGVDSPAMEALTSEAISLLKRRTGTRVVSVVGIGFGGTLAVHLSDADASVEKAVAIDPPATEHGGWPSANALRELKPVDIATGFLRPAARRAGGGRISLSGMLVQMPPDGNGQRSRVTVIGTSDTWFNSPAAVTECYGERTTGTPVLLPGRHSTIATEEKTLRAVRKALC